MKARDKFHLLFVCVSNRNRSPFSEFFFQKMIRQSDDNLADRVRVSSAGFIPRSLYDLLAKKQISWPEPFYGRPIAKTTRTALLKHNIDVPSEWRSRELSPDMVESADLIITAVSEQKKDLQALYPKSRTKIFSIREMAGWDTYLLSEDPVGLPDDDTFWDYVEEDPIYVAKVLEETEEILIRAFTSILSKMGLGVEEYQKG